jgi:hypothetical protein
MPSLPFAVRRLRHGLEQLRILRPSLRDRTLPEWPMHVHRARAEVLRGHLRGHHDRSQQLRWMRQHGTDGWLLPGRRLLVPGCANAVHEQGNQNILLRRSYVRFEQLRGLRPCVPRRGELPEPSLHLPRNRRRALLGGLRQHVLRHPQLRHLRDDVPGEHGLPKRQMRMYRRGHDVRRPEWKLDMR